MSTVQAIISTPNFDKVRAFYVGLLGAVETTRYPAQGAAFYVGFKVGDSDLGLVNEAGAAGPSSRFALSVAVDDVDALLSRVEANGGRVQGPPNDMPWGQRVAHVYDPDGNMVNLTQTLPEPEAES
ncbi:VOC family protein [Actinoplanes sp. LDG1-06]|uniref:VOC family protein n=1 Tax=Paractinoplanes ovalisporus TaxID=2810368 RepID=A0ABS2AIR7_9ACTN|nr:VOC family protein [Actinoplanes ovalisporus]MBM2619739.1 VOC family protein [Actinoplanes ovalisporus]